MFEKVDLESLPVTRIPVVLALDTSASMTGSKIAELNKGIEKFYENVLGEEESKYSVDLSIISFGKDGVKTVLDFDMIINQRIPELVADNMTPMGEGVEKSLALLESRKSEYVKKGIDYYQPWLVLMTDGFPTDDVDYAINQTRALVKENKLTIFPIGIGDDADLSVIGEFSPNRPALRLKGLNFVEFFQWLSKSVVTLSQSSAESDVVLGSVSGWSTL